MEGTTTSSVADQHRLREDEHYASREGYVASHEAYVSAVSWSAVIAGAFVAAALALILLALGTGFSMSMASPWRTAANSLSPVSKLAIVWLILIQIISYATGGYLAGRLRTKWTSIHDDEVYFRDTAHGFLVWAVGIVVSAAFLTSAASAMVGTAETQTTAVASESPFQTSGASNYYADMLLGPDQVSTDPILRAEVGRIFVYGLTQKGLTPAQSTFLTRVVAVKTGAPVDVAAKRVNDVFSAALQSEKAARKTVAVYSIWLFIALLAGAFCASYAATIGGRERDHVKILGTNSHRVNYDR